MGAVAGSHLGGFLLLDLLSIDAGSASWEREVKSHIVQRELQWYCCFPLR